MQQDVLTAQDAPLKLVLPPLTSDKFPFVLARNVSPEALRLALDKTEESIWRYMRYDRKGHTVYIVELPSFEHETPGGEILRQIVKAETLAGVPDNQCCEILSSPRCTVTNSQYKEPDGSLRPTDKPKPGRNMAGAADEKGNPYPNLVIEVGYDESLPMLQDDATVEIVIIIKIYKPFTNGRVRMRAELWQRGLNGSPTTEVEFGTGGVRANSAVPGPTQAGTHMLQIPLVRLYAHTPGGVPAQFAPHTHVAVDLFTVQQ